MQLLATFSALFILTAPQGVAHQQQRVRSVVKLCPSSIQYVYKERNATRNLERKMGHSPSRSSFNASTTKSCAYVRWVGKFWREEHGKRGNEYRHWLKQQALVKSPSWLVNAFKCIHRYEGSWDDATGNGYYGGLQMDLAFQSLYGRDYLHLWGTANNWPPDKQIEVAIRAHKTRGFGPWPNTARICNLL